MVNCPARAERGGSLQSLILANTLETDLAGVESVCLPSPKVQEGC